MSTLQLIENLRSEIKKLIPSNELYRGKLADWKLSKYLGLNYKKVGTHYVDDISNKIKYLKKNPNYRLTLQEINTMKKSSIKYFAEKSKNLIYLLEVYGVSNNLKRYPMQQTNVKNSHCFEKLNNVKSSFWYAFLMADGSLSIRQYKKSDSYSKKYGIWLELQIADKDLIKQFRDFIQLDPASSSYRIREREREWIRKRVDGKEYRFLSKTAYLHFLSKEMGLDLISKGFGSSKFGGRDVPDFNKECDGLSDQQKKEIILAWLLGYYCGDGISGTSRIISINKEFLENIKQVFNIKYPVKIINKEEVHIDKNGELKLYKAMYSLTIGAKLFNEMWEVGMKYQLGLERKYKLMSDKILMNDKLYNDLIQKLELLKINKDTLQQMVYEFKSYELLRLFETTHTTFIRVCNDWNIKVPQSGLGKSDNNKYLGSIY